MTSCSDVILTCATYSGDAGMSCDHACALPDKPYAPRHSRLRFAPSEFSGSEFSRSQALKEVRGEDDLALDAHAHLWRRSAGRISEDFAESRSIVCMIDRVCL